MKNPPSEKSFHIFKVELVKWMWAFISLSPTSTSPICQLYFAYVANTKFNYGKLVAWQIWQVDFMCPPCSLCRVAKSKSTPPTCQVTKSTLPSHQVHIAKSPSSHCQVMASILRAIWKFKSWVLFLPYVQSSWMLCREIDSPSAHFFFN